MHVVGIDLAGPANAAETALLVLAVNGGGARCVHQVLGADDARVRAVVADLPPPVVVGLGAPLSYEAGGGDRAADRTLRARLTEAGLPAGSVLTPTLPLKVSQTLRGLAVARLLGGLKHAPRVVEVHPTGALALRGAPLDDLQQLGRDADARRRLRAWLEQAEIEGLQIDSDRGEHHVLAAAAALAAWDWARGKPAWLQRAAPPQHPFDACC